MHWTTDKPTEPGWYWYRDSQGMEVANVTRTSGGTLCITYAHGGLVNVECISGEWAGPIREPVDAPVLTFTNGRLLDSVGIINPRIFDTEGREAVPGGMSWGRIRAFMDGNRADP